MNSSEQSRAQTSSARARRGRLRSRKTGPLAILLSLCWLSGQAAPDGATAPPETPLFRRAHRNARVHDPSTIVTCNNEYWLFATGPGVSSWHSRDLVTWTNGPRVFDRQPAWTTNAVPGNHGYFWAPDVIAISNRFLLYYSVSTFGKNTSAIALATNPTLDPSDARFAWTDCGPVIQSTAADDFNTIDPSVSRDVDGRLWLAFGSFWSGIKLVELDPRTGKRPAPPGPVYSLAHNSSIEAACLYRRNHAYYLFVNWGTCCRGLKSTYNMRFGRSEKITGPYFDKNGIDLMAGGGTALLETDGAMIGPGHAGFISAFGTNWLSFHFYDGTKHGQPALGLLPLRWSADGWPEVAPLLP